MTMDATQLRDNRALLLKLVVIVVAMFGFGYALVPFYEKICEATGIRNIGRADTVANTQVDATREVRIEVMFEVVNTTDRPLTGQAVPSYGPQQAGQYFKKLDCFCFAKQTLQPGETRQMPVVFVIDRALPADIVTITLSYTFFEVEGADKS